MKTALQPPPPPPVENGPNQFTGCQAPFGLSPREIISAAVSSGMQFLERVTDGELVVAGLERLAPDDRQRLQSNWSDVRDELLPVDHSTPSLHLLEKFGVEFIFIDTEEGATAEVQRICDSVRTLGLDLETAPRPEFLPAERPITVTKD